jgi:hypothetical protein
VSDLLFDDQPKPKRVRRKRMPDPLWNWVELRFFSGRVAAKQQTTCGEAAKLFAEKGLNTTELELRCRRHGELWPECFLTLRSLMTHIDDLAKPTPQEAKRGRKRTASDATRKQWFAEREDARRLSADAVARCKTRHHGPGSQPDHCADCKNLARWGKEYGWTFT